MLSESIRPELIPCHLSVSIYQYILIPTGNQLKHKLQMTATQEEAQMSCGSLETKCQIIKYCPLELLEKALQMIPSDCRGGAPSFNGGSTAGPPIETFCSLFCAKFHQNFLKLCCANHTDKI